jgi:hypothetical protein
MQCNSTTVTIRHKAAPFSYNLLASIRPCPLRMPAFFFFSCFFSPLCRTLPQRRAIGAGHHVGNGRALGCDFSLIPLPLGRQTLKEIIRATKLWVGMQRMCRLLSDCSLLRSLLGNAASLWVGSPGYQFVRPGHSVRRQRARSAHLFK